MTKIIHVFTVAAGLLLTTHTFGQVDEQLWVDYNLTVPLTKNISYGGDAGLRGIISNEDWNQLIIRPQIRYRWNQVFSVAGALAAFWTYNVGNYNAFEYRMHQEANVNWPDLGFLSLFYRVRIEERFFFYQNDALENDFNVRGRILAGIETQDFRLGEGKRPFFFQGMWEGFKTLGDESGTELFVNQARIHGMFGHRVAPLWRYEIQYIWQRSRAFADAGLETTQNIIRIRVFHRLPSREARRNGRDSPK